MSRRPPLPSPCAGGRRRPSTDDVGHAAFARYSRPRRSGRCPRAPRGPRCRHPAHADRGLRDRGAHRRRVATGGVGRSPLRGARPPRCADRRRGQRDGTPGGRARRRRQWSSAHTSTPCSRTPRRSACAATARACRVPASATTAEGSPPCWRSPRRSTASRIRPRAPIDFVATTGEEGAGDLRGAKAFFGAATGHIAAAVALDGAGDERVVHRGLRLAPLPSHVSRRRRSQLGGLRRRQSGARRSRRGGHAGHAHAAPLAAHDAHRGSHWRRHLGERHPRGWVVRGRHALGLGRRAASLRPGATRRPCRPRARRRTRGDPPVRRP